MVNVNVNFNGRDYLLACEEGQEEDLQKLTDELSQKFNQLKKDLGNLGEGKLLLITSIQIIDELYTCLLYTSPSPRDGLLSRMPSSA